MLDMTYNQNSHLEYVWIQSSNKTSPFAVPQGVRILQIRGSEILIIDNSNQQYWVNETDIMQTMHITSQMEADNMLSLHDLQEYTILHNLEKRYYQKNIYTYIGTILVAVNPYEMLPLYSDKHLNKYRGRKMDELAPHIFAISDNAYQQMLNTKANQCIVISGESGAGKTESTKFILQYLCAYDGKSEKIQEQIIAANPILEAFGNAKTVRNDNSSRFGKYIKIHFAENGQVLGGQIQQFLLEKSRLVCQSQDERNYHIFYSLLAGLDKEERKHLHLTEVSPDNYYYLSQSGCTRLLNRNDAEDFIKIKSAMDILMFRRTEIWNIFKCLSAILNLGNLKVKAMTINHIEVADILDSNQVNMVAALLSVNPLKLRQALLEKAIQIQDENVVIHLSKGGVLESRDAFVKLLYGRLFIYIVKRINEIIHNELMDLSSCRSIGVLDIFGFENFENNSFEQLCINYANENLQQFFVKHVFKMEQAEYEKDAIQWNYITYPDNQNILDMIGMKAINIMSLMDEETIFPKGSDQTLLQKIHAQHGNRSIYIKPKSCQEFTFGIRHYAGIVIYNPVGFLEKNRDCCSLDLIEIIAKSKNEFFRKIFPQFSVHDTMRKQLTLSMKFRNSLESLMCTLASANPYFIRCIKPNEMKKANLFDRELCVRQLRYSGIMETIQIRRAGYSIRYTHAEFIERFHMLWRNKRDINRMQPKQIVSEICKNLFSPDADYQLGQRKVFLKISEDNILQKERCNKRLKAVKILQRNLRYIRFERFLRKHRQAAILIQKIWRGYRARRNYLIMHQGFQRLVACIKANVAASHYVILCNRVKIFQAYCRGNLFRRRFKIKCNERLIKAKAELPDRKSVEEIISDSQEHLNHADPLQNTPLASHLNISVPKAQEHHPLDVESSRRIVDALFGFLNDTDTVSGSNGSNVRQKSLMLERQLNQAKYTPSKLLSRPVNYYESDVESTPAHRILANVTYL